MYMFETQVQEVNDIQDLFFHQSQDIINDIEIVGDATKSEYNIPPEEQIKSLSQEDRILIVLEFRKLRNREAAKILRCAPGNSSNVLKNLLVKKMIEKIKDIQNNDQMVYKITQQGRRFNIRFDPKFRGQAYKTLIKNL